MFHKILVRDVHSSVAGFRMTMPIWNEIHNDLKKRREVGCDSIVHFYSSFSTTFMCSNNMLILCNKNRIFFVYYEYFMKISLEIRYAPHQNRKILS